MVRKWLKQLLVNSKTHDVSVVDNAHAADALDFEHAKFMAPRLGSADLCRLGASADHFGFEVIGVTLRDRTLHPLPEQAEDELVEDVVAAMKAGQTKIISDLLHGDRGPYVIVAVVLMDEHTGEDVEIGRMGSYQASTDEPFEKLVRPAFTELQLS